MITIEAASLVKSYRRVRALDGLSFQVAAGEIFALLGPNGAGKTTAVRCLATLTIPDAGRAVVADIDVVRRPDLVRRRIGYVAQSLGADREATGRENLLLHGHLHRLSGRRLRQRVATLLEQLQLAEVADRFVRQYSGGMRRRLDIALGLLPEPEVLFLDEPTAGLDPASRTALWQLLRRLRRQGLTVLLTTHYLEEADQLADRLAIVNRGRVAVTGTPAALKADVPARVTLRVADPLAAAALLADLPGFRQADRTEAGLTVSALDGSRFFPAAVTRLAQAGVAVEEASLQLPSLDDVYVTHTGSPFPVSDLAEGGVTT
ncbi:MAG: ATP-binding cassette domain-containing protein [Thermaerobacter sp.]|jgi:ABC-2 type transport system ATP-binding protein|nr:ATP-binding cassette domain-containing protein [Thermaerobacter sp.]